MKVIRAGYEILTPILGNELRMIELAGRTCYKSENKITDTSSVNFANDLIKRHHEAMLEHSSLSVKFICDRGVSHELVRHRLASFAQESTRYCNYSNGKFENELTFIEPFFFFDVVEKPLTEEEVRINTYKKAQWISAMKNAEMSYFNLIKAGATPQEARSVLPNSIKTEVIMTANYREWRHFFNLRAARATGPAHPQMEEITRPLLAELASKIPIIFDDMLIMGTCVY